MKPKHISKKQWNRGVDCYDLKTGEKKQFDNYYLVAEKFGVSYDAVYVAIEKARPILKNRYFLIFSDSSVNNRRFILSSQMSYYKIHLLPKRDRINFIRNNNLSHKLGKNLEV
jgi:hypothetical protein